MKMIHKAKQLIGMSLLMFFTMNAVAQIELVKMSMLDDSFVDYQSGEIPVFSSFMLRQGETEPVLVKAGTMNYDPRDKNILMAVMDNRLVLLPKRDLQISNGFEPFKNLMHYDGGHLLLEKSVGVARWTVDGISNGYFKYIGSARIKSFIQVADTANNVLHRSDLSQYVTSLVNDDDFDPPPPPPSTPPQHDINLELFLWELGLLDPWEIVGVYIDGVFVEMSAGAIRGHLRTGAFHLAGGNRFNPEYP